jgi:hypothetical protein
MDNQITFKASDNIGKSVRVSEDSMWNTCGYSGILHFDNGEFWLMPTNHNQKVSFKPEDIFFYRAFRENGWEHPLVLSIQLKKR